MMMCRSSREQCYTKSIFLSQCGPPGLRQDCSSALTPPQGMLGQGTAAWQKPAICWRLHSPVQRTAPDSSVWVTVERVCWDRQRAQQWRVTAHPWSRAASAPSPRTEIRECQTHNIHRLIGMGWHKKHGRSVCTAVLKSLFLLIIPFIYNFMKLGFCQNVFHCKVV